jgi:hypothetical protein
MPMQIAIEPEIAENIESVIRIFEGAAELVAAVPALGKLFLQDLPPLGLIHLGNSLAQLL